MTLPRGLDMRATHLCLRATLLLASLSVLLSLVELCRSIERAEAGEAGQIDIAYRPPKDAAHQPLYALLLRNRVLEKMQAFLGPFRLPRRVLLKTEGCGGTANAFSG